MAKRLAVAQVDVRYGTMGLASSFRSVKNIVAGQFKRLARLAMPLGAALGVAGVGFTMLKAIRGLAAFEDKMSEVFTLLPGISQDAMNALTAQVKQFAIDFGVLPEQVVPALYQAISAGVPKENVFDFLVIAQKAAKGGATDLATAIDGITSVVNVYGAEVLSAAQASDLMLTAVRFGKTTMAELSQSLFQTTRAAQSVGIAFGDVTAALATMTIGGTPTRVATVQLRQALVELSRQGTQASKEFEKIAGKSFRQFIASGGNVQKALALMEQRAKATGVGVNDLFSSVEAGSAALSLTGTGAQSFIDNLNSMETATGATDAAFLKMTGTLKAKMNKALAAIKVAMLEVGEALKPVVTLVLRAARMIAINLAQAIKKLTDRTVAWFEKQEQLQTTLAAVGARLKRIWLLLSDAVVGFATNLGKAFGKDIAGAFAFVLDKVTQFGVRVAEVINVLANNWEVFGGVLVAGAEFAFNKVSDLWRLVTKDMGATMASLLSAMLAGFNTWINNIIDNLGRMIDLIEKMAKLSAEQFTAALTGITPGEAAKKKAKERVTLAQFAEAKAASRLRRAETIAEKATAKRIKTEGTTKTLVTLKAVRGREQAALAFLESRRIKLEEAAAATVAAEGMLRTAKVTTAEEVLKAGRALGEGLLKNAPDIARVMLDTFTKGMAKRGIDLTEETAKTIASRSKIAEAMFKLTTLFSDIRKKFLPRIPLPPLPAELLAMDKIVEGLGAPGKGAEAAAAAAQKTALGAGPFGFAAFAGRIQEALLRGKEEARADKMLGFADRNETIQRDILTADRATTEAVEGLNLGLAPG